MNKKIKIISALALGMILTFGIGATKANAEAVVSAKWVDDANGTKLQAYYGDYAKGWNTVDSVWYYFYDNGYLAKDTIIEGKYRVTSTGAWDGITLNPSNQLTTNVTSVESSNAIRNYYDIDTETWTHNKRDYVYTDIRGGICTTDSRDKYNEFKSTSGSNVTEQEKKELNESEIKANGNNALSYDNMIAKSGNQVSDENCDEGKSITDVVNKWNTLKPTFSGNNIFEVEPSTKVPYKPGKVNREYLNDTLNYLNFARYLANLEPVKLDSDLTNKAQYGALLTTVNKRLEHTNPIHPSDMPNNIYEFGQASTSSSNLCGGKVFESINECLNDDHNLMGSDNIGHREWLLDAKVTKIGFGTTSSYSTQNLPFSDFDDSVDYPDYLAWPSQGAFPNSFIRRQAVWSVNLNKDIYDMNNDVKVKVTRLCDGKEWDLSKVNSFSNNTTGFKVLSNNNYGSGRNSNTIIFHIGNSELLVEKYLGKYKVEILGLNKDVEYTINFFNLNK